MYLLNFITFHITFSLSTVYKFSFQHSKTPTIKYPHIDSLISPQYFFGMVCLAHPIFMAARSCHDYV